ncbi:MAG: transporter substrate-binding protein [Enterovirga sp.]|jgi:branched-chain amino acid transport system substrate-binding protein|nr:transporter substrate-binding protein [Enterovirga sp.]
MRSRLSLGAALSLAMAAVPAAAQDLVLGFSTAKTGPYVSLASANEIAVEIAVQEINDKGGVNGKKLRVVRFDTGGDPKQAALAVRQFAEDDKALAVIGPFSSSEVRVAFPAGERLSITQMSMSSSAPGLTKGFQFAFRNTTDEGVIIDQVLATLKDKKLPAATAAIAFATDDIVSKSVGTAVLPSVFKKYGLPVQGTTDFQYNAFDLSPQVSQLVRLNVDIVGLGSPPEAAINLAKEAKRQGLKSRIIGGATVADPDLPARMDGAGDGLTIGTTYFADVNDRTRAFAAEFGKRAKAANYQRTEPNQMDAASYDIVLLYAEAMKRANITGDAAKVADERKQLRDALMTLKEFPGVEGPLTFNAERDMIKPIYIVEARDKKWNLLDTRMAQ